MKRIIYSLFLLVIALGISSARSSDQKPREGYEKRIRDYVDTIQCFDTHEHLFNPEALKRTAFQDFSLLLHQNCWDDLVSAGMPNQYFNAIYNSGIPVAEKWKLVKPYWEKTFNTTSIRVFRIAANDLYGIPVINDSTILLLSSRIKDAYQGNWFNTVLREKCRFKFVVQESDFLGADCPYVHYTDKFTDWMTIKSKFRLDSLAAAQVEPIFTLDDFVKSLRIAFEEAEKMGMVAVKVNTAYYRTLKFDNPTADAAKKVFRGIVSGNEDFRMTDSEAKPLQDYMLRQLLALAKEHKIPVAFHTGLQAGGGNYLYNSDPEKLTNLFIDYPDIKFVLYHGSYPFGGNLAALAKNFQNVYIDMNWTYSIAPSYSARYLSEWLEAVPVSKIMAFGGDQRAVENTYGELQLAREVIADVVIEKVRSGEYTEDEAKTVARLIMLENGQNFYNLK
ncbi:MAG: amidohydrolase family protein [Bacteroidales bacterium]